MQTKILVNSPNISAATKTLEKSQNKSIKQLICLPFNMESNPQSPIKVISAFFNTSISLLFALLSIHTQVITLQTLKSSNQIQYPKYWSSNAKGTFTMGIFHTTIESYYLQKTPLAMCTNKWPKIVQTISLSKGRKPQWQNWRREAMIENWSSS